MRAVDALELGVLSGDELRELELAIGDERLRRLEAAFPLVMGE